VKLVKVSFDKVLLRPPNKIFLLYIGKGAMVLIPAYIFKIQCNQLQMGVLQKVSNGEEKSLLNFTFSKVNRTFNTQFGTTSSIKKNASIVINARKTKSKPLPPSFQTTNSKPQKTKNITHVYQHFTLKRQKPIELKNINLKYTNSTTTAIKYKNLKTRSVASPKL
jgi:hypothetical protein